MSPVQLAARVAIERFVTQEDGDMSAIVEHENAYEWTAPDGRVARVAWEESPVKPLVRGRHDQR